jgi:hypothetical protein
MPGPLHLIACLALLAGAWPLGAQELAVPSEPAHPSPIEVVAAYETDRWQPSRARIELQLVGSIGAGERIAILLDRTDLSGLFMQNGDRLVYDARVLPFPRGAHELVVFHVSGAEWREVTRLPLRVLGPLGIEQATASPKLDVNNKGQVASGAFPSAPSSRATFQDVTFSTGVQTSVLRNGWTVRLQSNFVGVSNQNEALQFGSRQHDAPRFDMSDYMLEIRRQRGSLTVGHVSFGSSRHLINYFSSRGITGQMSLGRFGGLGLAAMNGSSLVGFDNIVGLDDHRHRVMSTTVGLEALPARPGGLRVEVTALDGSLLPVSSFTQGSVPDAEKSSGVALAVSGSDPSQRVRGGVGITRSRFVNPPDATMFPDADVVPVEPETKSAQWAEVSAELIRQLRLTRSLSGSLTAAYRHERVDPLFRSVASYARADMQQDAYELNAAIGPVSAQFTSGRSSDNLDRIPSVLTTLTRNTGMQMQIPLASIIPGAGQTRFVPALSLGYVQTHQFGRELPLEDEFAPSHVPDQMSINRTAGLQWQGARWRAGYAWSRSFQDNRQVGRAASDFRAGANMVTLGFTPHSTIDLTLDGGVERAENLEFEQEAITRRAGISASWRPWRRTALTFASSRTRQTDEPRTSVRRNSDLRLELSQAVDLRGGLGFGLPLQVFARFAEQRAVFEPVGESASSRRNWSVSSGVNVRMF